MPLVGCARSTSGGGHQPGDAAVPHLAMDLAAADLATSVDRTAVGDAPSPPPYHIDLSRTSVSGLSSGGFMAVQFHVAFSSIMKGAAIFAGGPYGCSQGQLATAESSCATGLPAIDVSALVTRTQAKATAGTIDATANLTGQRVFLFGGADDTVVNPSVMDALSTYYAALLAKTSIVYVSRRPNTSHTWPTPSYGNPCALLASPFVGDCGYDGAGLALAQIYGALNPAATQLSGTFLSLAQADFVDQPAAHSLAATAYAYVPASCSAGETCAVHVAFHGCLQSESVVGDAFYKHAGLNEWADTNHLIVLYPQTIASLSSPTNPDGCWDFWGYDSTAFDEKSAPQMAMVRAMLAWLAS